MRIGLSIERTPVPCGSSPANCKLHNGGDNNGKGKTCGNGDDDTLPGKTMQPPECKQAGNDDHRVGRMGNYGQNLTGPGTFDYLLQSVAHGVVEPFEGSKIHGLDYSRYSSVWATNSR